MRSAPGGDLLGVRRRLSGRSAAARATRPARGPAAARAARRAALARRAGLAWRAPRAAVRAQPGAAPGAAARSWSRALDRARARAAGRGFSSVVAGGICGRPGSGACASGSSSAYSPATAEASTPTRISTGTNTASSSSRTRLRSPRTTSLLGVAADRRPRGSVAIRSAPGPDPALCSARIAQSLTATAAGPLARPLKAAARAMRARSVGGRTIRPKTLNRS